MQHCASQRQLTGTQDPEPHLVKEPVIEWAGSLRSDNLLSNCSSPQRRTRAHPAVQLLLQEVL